MAEKTTVNVGEPADERSVDASPMPHNGKVSEDGDQERNSSPGNKLLVKSGDLSERFDKFFPGFQFDHSFYDDQSGHHSSTDSDWNEKASKDSGSQITKTDVFFKIMPLIGAASYEYFSLKIMNPSWFLRAFYGNDQIVSNVLWLQSHIGIGCYIFSRRHLLHLSWSRRLIFSAFGSLIFNYGSCLLWAVGKGQLPHFVPARVGFGLVTGGLLLLIGQEYLQTVDVMCYDQID